jgi:hypothetical protein
MDFTLVLWPLTSTFACKEKVCHNTVHLPVKNIKIPMFLTPILMPTELFQTKLLFSSIRIHEHTVTTIAIFTFTSCYEQCVLNGTFVVSTNMETLP